MFKKIHVHLTLLFTVISTLILTVMSVVYLYFNYKSVHNNAMLSFKSDINTFADTFSNNNAISYDTLLALQRNYDYSFYIYDNGKPFQFVHDTKSDEQKNLIAALREYYESHFTGQLTKHLNAYHQEFSYTYEHKNYYCGVITIYGEKSNTQVFAVYSIDSIEAQINETYIQFAVVILISCAALFIFSWFYTGHLLRPLSENQQRQTRFIAAASHEIRNPVNTMISAVNAMEKGSDEQRKEFISIAKKEGKRLSVLTDDLLMLARSDSHSFSVSLGPAQLDTLILECSEAFAIRAREKKISLTARLPENSLTAQHIDPERIKQVIAILLDNAISYTPEKGKIILSCSETTKSFCIEVSDNGPGIDDAHKQSIFERFYRVDESRENKSHFGLGLCIAKEIVDMHKGSITVCDTPGGGCTFRVVLDK